MVACVVLDVFARKAVGWDIDRKADTSLVNSALNTAAQTRTITKGLILHADHGPQFTSWAFATNVTAYGNRINLGTVGDCFDNAMIEAFRGRMQTELLNRKKWTAAAELSVAMADYIENFHNTTRRHTALVMLTPTDYETINTTQLQLA